MPVRLITAPALEPVTVAEAKSHLRLESTLDDADVARLIRAAREYVELVCWRGLLTQTWELSLDGFYGEDTLELGSRNTGRIRRLSYIELPMGELQSVSSVKYLDMNGALQTLAGSEYDVDLVNVPGRLRLAYGKSWPATREAWNAVRITYVVGWSAAGGVPEAIKQAMKLCISQMYETRLPSPTGTSTTDALLEMYRLVRL